MDYTTGDSKLICDNCGRPIPNGKGYACIDGWYICGICQWKNDNIIPKELIRNKEHGSSDNCSIA